MEENERQVDEQRGCIVFARRAQAPVRRSCALAVRGSGAGMARARVAKEMREKRAILERENMAESWSRRASRDENDVRSEGEWGKSEESCCIL
jgi:hypothetical protein